MSDKHIEEVARLLVNKLDSSTYPEAVRWITDAIKSEVNRARKPLREALKPFAKEYDESVSGNWGIYRVAHDAYMKDQNDWGDV